MEILEYGLMTIDLAIVGTLFLSAVFFKLFTR